MRAQARWTARHSPNCPAAALAARNYASWSKALAASLYQNGAVELLAAKSLKLTSNPGESEGDFRARLAQGLRELRDREVAKLREKHAAKLKSLDDRLQRARRPRRARKGAVHAAQARHGDLDRHLRARRDLRRAQRRDDARGFGGALRRARIRRAR